MSPLLRHQGCAGARPSPGRSSLGLTALRGLHLDRTCAPAVTWQLTEAGQTKISSNQSVHASRGTPESQGTASTGTMARSGFPAAVSSG